MGNTHQVFLRPFVFAVVLSLLLPATGAFAAPTEVPAQAASQVQSDPLDSPALDDSHWPIIQMEQSTYIDPVTGAVHTSELVVRRQPASEAVLPANAQEACQQILAPEPRAGLPKMAYALATCSYVAAETRTGSDTVSYGGGWVKGYVKSWAYVYSGSDGNKYADQYQARAWWKRSDKTWTVTNAWMKWGCGNSVASCTTCSGSSYKKVLTLTIGTVYWPNNGLTSSNYTSYYSSFPILRAETDCELNVSPGAGAFGEGRKSGTKRGTTLPSLCWT